MQAITDAISTALPFVFVIGSAAFIARFLRPAFRRDGRTFAVAVLAGGIGVFWAQVAMAFARFGAPSVPWQQALLVTGFAILLSVAGALDIWVIATRSSLWGMAAIVLAVAVGAGTVPAIIWSSYLIGSAGRTADTRAADAELDRLISERSAPMSLVVQDATVTLDGPVPTYGPGAQGVDGHLRLRVDLVSTSTIAVDAGTPFLSVEVRDPRSLNPQMPAEFWIDTPPLPTVIPVGTTRLDLILEGGAVAGGDMMSESAIWTVRLQFNWSEPGTGYLVTTTFRPVFAPLP